jgi:hypothetical protein
MAYSVEVQGRFRLSNSEFARVLQFHIDLCRKEKMLRDILRYIPESFDPVKRIFQYLYRNLDS